MNNVSFGCHGTGYGKFLLHSFGAVSVTEKRLVRALRKSDGVWDLREQFDRDQKGVLADIFESSKGVFISEKPAFVTNSSC